MNKPFPGYAFGSVQSGRFSCLKPSIMDTPIQEMANETNYTFMLPFSSPTSDFADPVLGIFFILLGVFGIIGNTITGLLITTDREMRNPTYRYMTNLCFADAVMHVPLSIIFGTVLIDPSLWSMTFAKISAYILTIGWNPSGIFMVSMSYSRFVQLKTPRTQLVTASKGERRRLWASIVLPWTLPAVIYCWMPYYEPPPVILLASQYAWSFNEATALGEGLRWLTVAWTLGVIISVSYFNYRSLMAVRQMRKQIRHIGMDRNVKREIKLFIQCALTAAIYSTMSVTYFAVNGIKFGIPPAGFIAAELLWILNHTHSPIVYFTLNRKLRRRFLIVVGLRKPASINTGTELRDVSTKANTKDGSIRLS